MVACDIFVLNSTYEGLPRILLEAMALRLPVVATAVGGTPEIVKDGETGVLITVVDESLKEIKWSFEQTEAVLLDIARRGDIQ